MVAGTRVQCGSVDHVTHYLTNRDRRRVPEPDGRPRPNDPVFNPTNRIYSRTQTFEGIIRIDDGPCTSNGSRNYHTEASITSRWNILPSNVLWYDPPNYGILAEIKGQKINLAMMLAEYRETSRMFVDAVLRLSSLYRDIRRGRVDRLLARGSKRGLASDWLLYRYGITPVVSDLQNSFEQLSQSWDTSLRYRYRWQSSQMFDGDHGNSPYPPPYEHPIHVIEKITVKDIAWVEYDSTTLKNLSSIGLLNPVQLAWEVIPFSFVVDWFINIGDCLSSLDALTGVKRYAYTRTFKVNSQWEWPTGGLGSHRVYNRSVRRLTPTLPSWNPSMSWKRTLDAISLAAVMRR